MTKFEPISMCYRALDAVMPLHISFALDGTIEHVGPTLTKILGGPVVGQDVRNWFDLRRPRNVAEFRGLLTETESCQVLVRLRDAYGTQFNGIAARRPNMAGALVNLSLGISVFDAVARYNLAGSDFAPTDQTLDLLYMAEANAAVMAESRALNHRLNGAKTEAEVAALTDTLTGLMNRRGLDASLHRLVERRTVFALAHLDLDFFKAVNDGHGHAAGDHVLENVARVLKEETRENDIVARVGGDEFILVFKGLVDEERLAALCERIIKKLERPIEFNGSELRISGSMGLTKTNDYQRPSPDVLIRDADHALYASKAAGRAQFQFFDPKEKFG